MRSPAASTPAHRAPSMVLGAVLAAAWLAAVPAAARNAPGVGQARDGRDARQGTRPLPSETNDAAAPTQPAKAALGATLPEMSVSLVSQTFAWRVSQPRCTPLLVENTGQVPITTLAARFSAVSSANLLVCAANVLGAGSNDLRIEPGQTASVEICPPVPSLAGTYTGALMVTANGTKTEEVALTVTTRGPTLGRQSGLAIPLALFCLFLAIGLAVSWALDEWFMKGGLVAAQVAIKLAELATDLTEVEKRLGKIGHLTNTTGAVGRLLRETNAYRRGEIPLSDDPLTDVARLSCGLSGARWTAAVLEPLPDAVRQKAAGTIDKEDLPTDSADLVKYRAMVEEAARAAQMAAGTQKIELPPLPTDDPPKVLRRRIALMAWVQRLLVWLVSGFAAYSTMYAPKESFGSSLDYIGVFVWALGITQAGTQILTQARWPARQP